MKKHATLIRLRQANPVPPTLFVDGTDLFAQITSQPPNADLRERSPRRRRLVLGLAVVAAAGVLASAAYAVSNWVVADDIVTPNVTQQEYLDAQRVLSVPPGFHWPTIHYEPNSVTGRGAGGGNAVLIAQTAWECYWVQAIRRGDRPAQRRSHAELQNLLDHNIRVAPIGASENWMPASPPKVPTAVFAHDGGLDWIKQGYAMAAAGNPERIAQGCRANS